MLLLLPNVLGEVKYPELYLPISVNKAVESLNGLIAESEKGGKRFLSIFKKQELPVHLLNEHTKDSELDTLLLPAKQGERWGVVSDGGLPCIADPGSKLVFRARQMGIPIQAFSGPSSVFLALMLSGMPGQQFTFNGYLHKDESKRNKQIKDLEKTKTTQIFIETPYRNQFILKQLISELNENTLLAVAWDLTLPSQGILNQPVKLWKKMTLPNLDNKNAIFLIGQI